ncbi:MAG: hypothetical protein RBS68_02440 [Anaerolineales bacterium]|nr:hypothetical protein [Anaerolineales bacterium]
MTSEDSQFFMIAPNSRDFQIAVHARTRQGAMWLDLFYAEFGHRNQSPFAARGFFEGQEQVFVGGELWVKIFVGDGHATFL